MTGEWTPADVALHLAAGYPVPLYRVPIPTPVVEAPEPVDLDALFGTENE